MKSVFLLFLALVILSSFVFAQPGNDGTLSIDVVDDSGTPVRGAIIDNGPRLPGQGIFIGRIFPAADYRNFKRLFRPRDGSLSSFIAPTFCDRNSRYSITVTAPGYQASDVAEILKSCADQITVKLKRNSDPLPKNESLTRLAGTLTADDSRQIRRFLIVKEGTEYVPKVDRDGKFSVLLAPGLYEIVFDEPRCTEYRIKDYRIAAEPRILNLNADCEN